VRRISGSVRKALTKITTINKDNVPKSYQLPRGVEVVFVRIDRVRAEGVSVNDYAILDIEKGTIIHATKDFKILNLKQILEKYLIENPERYVQPDVHVGGWNKFIKTEINSKAKRGSRAAAYVAEKSAAKKSSNQQSKKRGWLHKT